MGMKARSMSEVRKVGNDETAHGATSWRVVAAQLFFGLFLLATGAWVSAEPTLTLRRDATGQLRCEVALNAYGRVPAVRAHVDDLVDYAIVEGERALLPQARLDGLRSERETTSASIVFHGRDGSSFAVGNAFDLAGIDRALADRTSGSGSVERISAGPLRRIGGLAAGAMGLLLLVGACWNILRLVLLAGRGRRTAAG